METAVKVNWLCAPPDDVMDLDTTASQITWDFNKSNNSNMDISAMVDEGVD